MKVTVDDVWGWVFGAKGGVSGVENIANKVNALLEEKDAEIVRLWDRLNGFPEDNLDHFVCDECGVNHEPSPACPGHGGSKP